MAGPGGSEHGRINIKVVPDTAGFTREVEALLKKYNRRDIDMRVELDTRAAETKIKKLGRTRDGRKRSVQLRVELDTRAAETKLKVLLRERDVNVNAKVDTSGVEAQLDALTRARDANIKADAQTAVADKKIDKAARDRRVAIRYRFIGDEAVRRLAELDRKRVQRVEFEFDDDDLRMRLRAIGRNNEIITRINVDERNIRDIRKWVGSLGEDFKEAGQRLVNNFDRIRREQDRVAREAASNKAWLDSMDEYRDTVIQFERQMEAARKAADKARAERQKKYSDQIRDGVRLLEREYRKFGRALPVEIELEVDKKKRLGKLRDEIDRLRRERVNIDVDVDYDRINRLFELLNMRDHKIRIDPEVDRNRLNRTGRMFGNVFRTAGGVAVGALAGVFRGLMLVSRMMGNVGDAAQSGFGRIATRLEAVAGQTGHWGQMIAQVVAGLLSLGVVVGVVISVINVIGALIVAAIGAVVAIGSVILGSLALLALPAIFAGVAAALVMMGDENNKVRQQFVSLGKTIRDTVTATAKPMIDLFSNSLERLNDSLKVGAPLHNQLATAFDQSAKALVPLRSGLSSFATTSLGGVNAALKNLNASGAMEQFAVGIGGLGSVIGNFAQNLSLYAPQFANGFNSLVAGLNRIQSALARWMGSFAQYSPSVIDSITDALVELFDTFSSNSRVFTNAAAALGDAIEEATPGIHDIATAFAQMAPGVFSALAEAINNLGDAVDDPAVVDGLANITSGIIKFASVVVKWGTQLTGILGNSFGAIRREWEKLSGTIDRGIDLSVEDFKRVISQEKSARDQVSIGLRQLDESVGRHTQNISNDLNEYRGQLFNMMTSADKSVSDHVRGLATKLWEMGQEWRDAGGKMSADWKKTWDSIGKQIDQSGDSSLIKIKDQMNGLIESSERFREKMKANLIAALESKGVNVDQTIIDVIDEQLGLLVDNSKTKSAEAITAFQENFSKLPGLMQTALEEAKTPEQFRQKMEEINKIMGDMSPKIAESFGELPTAMKKHLTESETAFRTWNGMEEFRMKVSDAVDDVIDSFSNMTGTINGISGRLNGLGVNAQTAAQGIHIFNNRANWLNWILNQVGGQASWAGWQIGEVGNNAGTAADAMHSLNEAANGLNSRMQTAGSTASAMSSQILGLSADASQAGAQFKVFATGVSNSMVTAHKAVGSWTYAMERRLSLFRSRSGNYGRLSSFISGIRASMAVAEDTVAGAVANMLGQLSRLNRTFTAKVTVDTSAVPSASSILPPGFTPMVQPMHEPVVFEPLSAMTTANVTADVAAAEAYSAWQRNADRHLRTTLRESTSGTAVGNTYNVNVEAAPYVPTEKTIVTALSYADALYAP